MIIRCIRCPALLALIFLTGVCRADTPSPPLSNEVILIIRHAEKPDNGPGLTPAGEHRARAYVGYFRHFLLNRKPLHLAHVIAAADSKHSSRPRLTVAPLSQALHLPLDCRFQDKDFTSLAAALHAHPGGKTILICWHHGEIPALLEALGANPNTLLPQGKWPGRIYDWVIQLQYNRQGQIVPAQTRRISEHLLPGDAN